MKAKKTKRKVIPIIFMIILLSACMPKDMKFERLLKNAMTNAVESSEIKLYPMCYLALYGNEDKTESYLLSIHVVSDEEKVYDSIKLDDYYTSIEQNPDNFKQLIINRNTEKDKSLMIDVSELAEEIARPTVKLQPIEYIETQTKTFYEIQHNGDIIASYSTLDSTASFNFKFPKLNFLINGKKIHFLDFISLYNI